MATLLDLLPASFEANHYRQRRPDLTSLTDQELVRHYEEVGSQEGLPGNRLTSRGDFVRLIPKEMTSLEIGPFCNPLLKGENVHYFDVLSRAGLEQRAREIGYPLQTAPDVDFVSPIGDLGVIDRQFDCVLSSHCIEHQPDLVAHLTQVNRILVRGGLYFLLIPDKRFCFDAFNKESTIADVLDAHHSQRKVHLLKSVIEHRALTTHNDPVRHWTGDHGTLTDLPNRVRKAIEQFNSAGGSYIDVHAWYFTPSSARSVFEQLRESGYINLDIARIYPPRRNTNEFWMVLCKSG